MNAPAQLNFLQLAKAKLVVMPVAQAANDAGYNQPIAK